MREILFRGKRISNGEWVEGGIMKTFHPNFEHENEDAFLKQEPNCYCICTGRKDVFVEQESIGQFTGLTDKHTQLVISAQKEKTDKNGKKIFEGDVVKFTGSPFEYSYTGVVCFNKGSFCVKYEYWGTEEFHRIGQTNQWQDMGASGIITYQYEILGNIHDNPELLGGAEDAK